MEHKGNLAIIVVDVQNDFCHPEGAFGKAGFDLSHIEKAIETLAAFVEACREAGALIIFVRTIHSNITDSESWLQRLQGRARMMQICRKESWGSEFYKVCPKVTEWVVTKQRYGAFTHTNLDLVLRSNSVTHLYITGVVTNVCVESTVRQAKDLDYDVALVEDCCGAFSPEEHTASVSTMSKYFARVLGSRQALAEIIDLKGGQREGTSLDP